MQRRKTEALLDHLVGERVSNVSETSGW